MAGPQQVLAINEGLPRQQRQSLRPDLHDPLALEDALRNMIAGQLAVGRVVLAQRKKFMERGVVHQELQRISGAQSSIPCPRQAGRTATAAPFLRGGATAFLFRSGFLEE